MKKFIFVILAIFTVSFATNAQVSYQKPQPKESESISSTGTICVLHRFKADTYDLYVPATHSDIDDSAFVYLGKGKNEALKSLTAIKKMIEDGEEDGHINISGKRWRIADLGWTKGAILMQECNISGNWIYLEDLINLIKKLS